MRWDSILPVELTRFEWTAPVFALANEMYHRYFQGGLPEPNAIVHFFIIGVSRLHRGKGVGQQLLDLSLEHARARGYRRAVVEASGLISQHILRKAGFIDRVEILYATFEYEGKRPFKHRRSSQHDLDGQRPVNIPVCGRGAIPLHPQLIEKEGTKEFAVLAYAKVLRNPGGFVGL